MSNDRDYILFGCEQLISARLKQKTVPGEYIR